MGGGSRMGDRAFAFEAAGGPSFPAPGSSLGTVVPPSAGQSSAYALSCQAPSSSPRGLNVVVSGGVMRAGWRRASCLGTTAAVIRFLATEQTMHSSTIVVRRRSMKPPGAATPSSPPKGRSQSRKQSRKGGRSAATEIASTASNDAEPQYSRDSHHTTLASSSPLCTSALARSATNNLAHSAGTQAGGVRNISAPPAGQRCATWEKSL